MAVATSDGTRPPATDAATERRMKATRQRDTAAEIALRRELHRRGYRYRVDVAPIQGVRRRADVVFTRHRVAVYVDGCFWHRCPEHATDPKSNASWWAEKLQANVRRDRDTDEQLRRAGWTVVRIWEHESPGTGAALVERAISRSPPYQRR